MTTPLSGAISFLDIKTEFRSAAAAVKFSDFYAGGINVPAGFYGPNGAVPVSGAIDLNKFHGLTLPTLTSTSPGTKTVIPFGIISSTPAVNGNTVWFRTCTSLTNTGTTYTYMSSDGGQSFTIVDNVATGAPGGMMAYANGRLLHMWEYNGSVYAMKSLDSGATWTLFSTAWNGTGTTGVNSIVYNLLSMDSVNGQIVYRVKRTYTYTSSTPGLQGSCATVDYKYYTYSSADLTTWSSSMQTYVVNDFLSTTTQQICGNTGSFTLNSNTVYAGSRAVRIASSMGLLTSRYVYSSPDGNTGWTKQSLGTIAALEIPVSKDSAIFYTGGKFVIVAPYVTTFTTVLVNTPGVTVYTSPDGLVWTKVSSHTSTEIAAQIVAASGGLSYTFSAAAFQLKVAVVGNVIVIADSLSTTPSIRTIKSPDLGVTWLPTTVNSNSIASNIAGTVETTSTICSIYSRTTNVLLK